MRKMKKFNEDSRGFTLVEMIIVLAIMAAVSGIAGFGFSMVSGRPAQQCANRLASAISHGRTMTMGKYRNTITIANDGGQLKVTEHTVITVDDEGNEATTSDRSSTVGAKGVTVEYRVGTGDYVELTEGNSIYLRYDSGSGALKATANGDKEYYTWFRISKAGTVRYVKLGTLTGSVEVKTTDVTTSETADSGE